MIPRPPAIFVLLALTGCAMDERTEATLHEAQANIAELQGSTDAMARDELTRWMVIEALIEKYGGDVEEVVVEVKRGEVTLSGTVPAHRAPAITKMIATTAAVEGVQDVKQQVRSR